MTDALRLFWRERRLLMGVAVLLVALRIALAWLPYARVYRLFTPGPRSGSRPSDAYCRRVAWAATVAGRRLLGSRPCLPQALAVRWMLLRHGEPTDLRIGVKKAADGALQAHAWLLRQGRVLIGGDASPTRYRPLEPVTSRLP